MGKLLTMAAMFAAFVPAQDSAPGVFTEAQAAAGRAAYASSCANCHTESLIPPADATHGGQVIPPLAGPAFLAKWGPQTTTDLANRIKVAIGGFPPKGTDSETYLNLTAFVLQANGAKPGSQPLTSGTMQRVGTTARGRGMLPVAVDKDPTGAATVRHLSWSVKRKL